MFTYEMIKDKAALLLAMTSLTRREFEELVVYFCAEWERYVKQTTVPATERQRRVGGGSKPALRTDEDRLLFILYYFKVYPLQEILGFEFGLSQGRACELIHILSEVLKQTLATMQMLPERETALLIEKLVKGRENEYVLDGTERRIQRPKNPTDQKKYYSGKKHAHTVKNNLVVTRKSRLVKYLSKTHEGKKHDKKICDEEQLTLPEGSQLYKDNGYQGYEPLGVETEQPKKKPRGKELSGRDKQRNRRISKLRIVVEHVIGGVKRCRIVKDILRNLKDGFADLVMEIACGLQNYRTACRSKRRLAQLGCPESQITR
jgi:hypothetical protein